MNIVVSPSGTIPEYKTLGDAGADLVCANESTVMLPSGCNALIPTGVKIAIPDGYFGMIVSRSSSWKKGLLVQGVVDSSYRGELFISVNNASAITREVEPGSRIAQLLILPVARVTFEPVETLDETFRGIGGFGSTGK